MLHNTTHTVHVPVPVSVSSRHLTFTKYQATHWFLLNDLYDLYVLVQALQYA